MIEITVKLDKAILEAAVEAAHEASKDLTAELERACSGRTDYAHRYAHGS